MAAMKQNTTAEITSAKTSGGGRSHPVTRSSLITRTGLSCWRKARLTQLCKSSCLLLLLKTQSAW